MGTQYERITEMLSRTGKSWADAAAAAKLTRAGKKKWVDGNFKSLETENLFILADLFGCDPRWLATGEGEAFPANDIMVLEMRSVWRNANAEGRGAMLEHARFVASQPRFQLDNHKTNGATATG